MTLFQSSRLKVERAQKHIADLEAEIARFSATNYYSLFVDKDVQGRNSLIALRVHTEVSPAIALVIGDAVHNLNSALDLLVSEVVLSHSGSIPKRLYFPFYEKRQELIGTMQKGPIQKASPAIASLIIDVIKPHRGGNDILFSLHDLDVMDKHKILLPVLRIVGVTGFEAHDDGGNRFVGCSMAIESPNSYRAAIMVNGEAHIDNYGKATFDILFPKGLGIEGKAVIPTLHYFTQLVNGIIDAFESACRGDH